MLERDELTARMPALLEPIPEHEVTRVVLGCLSNVIVEGFVLLALRVGVVDVSVPVRAPRLDERGDEPHGVARDREASPLHDARSAARPFDDLDLVALPRDLEEFLGLAGVNEEERLHASNIAQAVFWRDSPNATGRGRP